MFSENFLFFNILLFSGFGVEILFGHKRSSFHAYFKVCLINAASLLINSILFCGLKEIFFKKYQIGDEYVFLLILASALVINEFLFFIVKHSDFNIFDSLNFVSSVFPMLLYHNSKGIAQVWPAAAGAALSFLLFSTIFYHIKRQAADNCEISDEFGVFCLEMIIFGLFSASFSIFFRVV
jgi:hypothetical protein